MLDSRLVIVDKKVLQVTVSWCDLQLASQQQLACFINYAVYQTFRNQEQSTTYLFKTSCKCSHNILIEARQKKCKILEKYTFRHCGVMLEPSKMKLMLVLNFIKKASN